MGIFFYTMYGVVDTFFAGFISTEALAALSISSPVFFFILSLSFGIFQGSTVLIANALGEKEHEKAHEICVQSISFGFLFAVGLTVIGLLLALKKTIPVIIICLYRQIIGPFVACYLLAFYFDIRETGVWWGFFLVAWSAAIVSYFYGQHVLRQKLASSQEPAESSNPVS